MVLVLHFGRRGDRPSSGERPTFGSTYSLSHSADGRKYPAQPKINEPRRSMFVAPS
ncbi:hypothetical protein [Amycolatopsis sp. NPDC049159]|uniref:hypothetical protein n=1 Tax=Amycolatopsis sp. NPDC049159 TaxID=3157210 RepID=UPI0033C14AC4